jgi:hypothetical protein
VPRLSRRQIQILTCPNKIEFFLYTLAEIASALLLFIPPLATIFLRSYAVQYEYQLLHDALPGYQPWLHKKDTAIRAFVTRFRGNSDSKTVHMGVLLK